MIVEVSVFVDLKSALFLLCVYICLFAQDGGEHANMYIISLGDRYRSKPFSGVAA
jgi:hypothetical protein